LDAEADRYRRTCPVHGLTLQAKELPEGYRNRAHPELECPSGHLVGVDCEVNYWNVCHVETGQVVYEADEEGFHQVNPRVLVVEPDDMWEPRPALGGHVEGSVTRVGNMFESAQKARGWH
jgi:hypothetical protein